MTYTTQKTAPFLKAALLYAGFLIAAMMAYTARAGISDCTIQSTQLLGPEHENIIAAAPGDFKIWAFVGAERYFQIFYRCNTDSAPMSWSIRAHSTSSVTHIGNSIPWGNVDPTPKPVLTTPQLTQYGLGFAGYSYPSFLWDPAWGGQYYFNNNHLHPQPNNTPSRYNNGQAEFGIDFRFRFVKINNNLDAILNNTVSTPYPLAFPLVTFSIVDNNSGYESPHANVTAHIPTLTIQQRACTPFVDTITLPSIDVSQLPSIGSTGATTDFRFTVRCPHNAARFGYYVESAHGYEDETRGVIRLDPASAAKGIGLQVTTRYHPHPEFTGELGYVSNYHPIKFGPINRYGDTSYVHFSVTGNPLTDESDYTFPHIGSPPLKIAVYRTGTLVPGPYTAALKIHMVYR